MSVIGSNILAGPSGQGGYFLTNSLRFRSSASANLSRTNTATGDSQKFTWSGWVKRGLLTSASDQFLFCSDNFNTSSNRFVFQIILKLSGAEADTLVVGLENSVSGTDGVKRTTQVFRDPSAWYHIVASVDTTQATAANRVKVYVNGVEVTAFAVNTNPNQNANVSINQNGGTPRIGAFNLNGSPQRYFDGYMTEVNFIDGQQLTPSSFGETSTTTGVWIPKKYTGTYGTNGFYLPFTNTASTSTLGNDFSGNGNNWTTNNISLTAGSTYDSMTDVPTLAELSGNGNSNYAVFNPLQIITTGQVTVTNGNLTASNTSGGDSNIRGTIFASTGKWYAELTITTAGSNYPTVGIIEATEQNLTYLGATAKSYCYTGGGSKGNNNSFTSYGASYTTGDVIGVAYDATNATLTFYKNGTSQGTAFTGVTAGSYTFACSTLTGTININFGQRPFAYTPPTGFVALNTFNLPTPTIGATASTTANKYMDATTYSGNGGTQSITSLGFQPDLVWVKRRDAVASHNLVDAVRGASKILYSDATTAEITDSNDINAFNSNGWTMGLNTDVNASGGTYVGWTWRGANATVSNTAGTITSTVSANTTAGFSIVTFTSQASGSSTIGHGLGVAPRMVIWKSRTDSTAWVLYHADLGADKYLNLNNTNASVTAVNVWNNTAPTSTVFSTGSDLANYGNIVAYCFAQVAGYSAFGSYTGNGSTDGTFIFTGFRPRFIMFKNATTGSTNWQINDSARDTYNVVNKRLAPSNSDAEATNFDFGDFLSNGFKIRQTDQTWNKNGDTYIYMAFAESPFKFANAR